MTKAKRKILCCDAVDWLNENQRELGSIITSLPELEEVSMNERDYRQWFRSAATQCFRATSEGHLTIFYQTDRLLNGRRISKAQMLMQAAEANDAQLIWHKIVLRRSPGKIDLRRPGYSHLLAFGDSKAKAGKATPDVFEAGGVLYPNGMGIQAATVALQAALRHGTRVCDPFCGRGTVPALAEPMGFTQIIGIDIDPDQCDAARTLKLGSVNVSATAPKKRFRLID